VASKITLSGEETRTSRSPACTYASLVFAMGTA
jgi:hypothetical protein